MTPSSNQPSWTAPSGPCTWMTYMPPQSGTIPHGSVPVAARASDASMAGGGSAGGDGVITGRAHAANVRTASMSAHALCVGRRISEVAPAGEALGDAGSGQLVDRKPLT